MKILIHSNAPFSATGYGNQTKLFAPRLRALGHEMAVSCFWGLQGGVIHWDGIPLYPNGLTPYGVDVMGAHAANFRADVLMTLMDAWVIDTRYLPPGMRWVPWFPIDHDPLPAAIRDRVRAAYTRIVYSRFGEAQCHAAGLTCEYVPHGIDTQLFQPRDRAEARTHLGWPADKFIVGMVAANKGNPSRKAFPENIAAFAELKRKRPDVMLYLHTVADESNQGVNLPEFIQSVGLTYGFTGMCDPNTVDVLFCDRYWGYLGLPDAYMSDVYNALDVLLSVSMGEGFGIPIVEAQACGTPVIVGDWTSMSELCFGGWKVARSDAEPYWTPLAAYQFIPHVKAIAAHLDTAYRKAGNVEIRERARAGALAYDADKVTAEYWQPILERIAADIAEWSTPVEAAG